MKKFGDFRDLIVYKKAFEQGCNIFDITLTFPSEEKYSLTEQIRRSARSVCTNYCRSIPKKRLFKTLFA